MPISITCAHAAQLESWRENLRPRRAKAHPTTRRFTIDGLDSARPLNTGHAALCGERNRNAHPNQGMSSSALAGRREGTRNSGLDGRRRPSSFKDGKVGRGNRKLWQGSMVVRDERTGDHRHILARHLPLGQIDTDRAVRFVANPFLIGKRLRDRGDLRGAVRRLARIRSAGIRRVVDAEKVVQSRSANRYPRHDSGEEASHDKIGRAIAQGRGEEKRGFRQDLYLHNYSLSIDCPHESRQTRENCKVGRQKGPILPAVEIGPIHTNPKRKRGNDLRSSLTLRLSVSLNRGQYT